MHAGFGETGALLLWIPALFRRVLLRLFKIIYHNKQPVPSVFGHRSPRKTFLAFQEKKEFKTSSKSKFAGLPSPHVSWSSHWNSFSASPADAYLSSVSNDPIIYTQPDRKLGILCMKYFAGVGGVNRLLNEASLPGRVMKISDEEENHCIMTCGGTVTHARARAHTRLDGCHRCRFPFPVCHPYTITSSVIPNTGLNP